MKITVQTLGCKVNQSESASIEGLLKNNNYRIVKHFDNPDVWIINTCTVTARSDHQSRQLIRKAVRSGARVIATGCYAQLRPDDLLNIDGLDMVIGNSGKTSIIDHLENLFTNDGRNPICIKPPESPLTSQPYHSGRARAFLKIQDGCNFSCSYCTVPIARGRSRSLDPGEIISSLEKLVADGYKEIVLTGIHIGFYGSDLIPSSSLAGLLRKLVDPESRIRIRLSSIEPQEIDDDLLSLLKEGFICPHLHIPLQSGSDKILNLMKRGYDTAYYTQVINRILTSDPNISIGTDIITGFPGETDKDFDQTVKYINEIPFSYLHVFPYSKRPNTIASTFSDQVSDHVKKQRVKKLLDIGAYKKSCYMKRNLSQSLDVIVEKRDETTGLYKSLSENYLKIYVRSDILFPGQRAKVKVVSLTDDSLVAEVVE